MPVLSHGEQALLWSPRQVARGLGFADSAAEGGLPPSGRLQLDLDINPGRQIEPHQRIDGLGLRIQDVHKPNVRPDFELLPRLLINMRRTKHGESTDLGRQRNRSRDPGARSLGCVHDLLHRLIEDPVIVRLQSNPYPLILHVTPSMPLRRWTPATHAPYSTTSLTTPAPTVRPPSRMAKRSSFSMAIGWMSSTLRATLSPGMTISVPAGSVQTPVTSVVRK